MDSRKTLKWGKLLYCWTEKFSVVKMTCVCAQLFPTLCDPMNCSLPGSSVCGIFQQDTGMGWHFLLQGIFWTQG